MAERCSAFVLEELEGNLSFWRTCRKRASYCSFIYFFDHKKKLRSGLGLYRCAAHRDEDQHPIEQAQAQQEQFEHDETIRALSDDV